LLAGCFSYHPAWLVALFAVRAVFVRFLGMRQEHMRSGAFLTPEMVPMQIGKRAAFLTVRMAEEGRSWFADQSATHLKGTLGVVGELLADQHKRFPVVTLVHDRNWTGPVSFQIIRPWHHQVVTCLAQAGRKENKLKCSVLRKEDRYGSSCRNHLWPNKHSTTRRAAQGLTAL